MPNEESFRVVRCTAEHVETLKGRFRAQDEEICRLVDDRSVDQIVMEGLKKGENIFAIVCGEEPVAIFGLVYTGVTGVFIPWIVAGRNVERRWLRFLRFCKGVFERTLARNDIRELFQYVPVHHESEHRFLGYLGFRKGERIDLYGRIPCYRMSLNEMAHRYEPDAPFRFIAAEAA